MGSQTFEILRQGVWASLTGGWFYDPHQNVFCNAVHLYLWLFLLCSPFVTYLYFPKTIFTWVLYCLMTGVTVAIVKMVNLALHVMYDEAQITSENHIKQTVKTMRETTSDENGGIELQVLGGGITDEVQSGATGLAAALVASSGGISGDNNLSNDISHANSAVSIEFEQVSSTIDLKVDVHRKNSSESSDLSSTLAGFKATTTSIQTHNADICQTSNHRRSFKTKSKSEEVAHHRSPISEEGGTPDESNDRIADIEAGIRDKQKKKLRSKLQRQVSLDAEKIGIPHWAGHLTNDTRQAHSSKLQRHRSTENTADQQRRAAQSSFYNPSGSTMQQHLQSVPSDLYYIPDDEDAYLNQQQTPMRKDSNSTMSALQLPTSSGASSSRVRRHSNTTGKPGSMVSVRRIKSAALETCCPQPSVSNLVPHPSSVETIGGGGHQLRNPQHAILPPPSKCMVRNPHLKLFPQPSTSADASGQIAMANSDSVYPIAELADERQHDNKKFRFGSAESDSDDDDDDDDEEEDVQNVNNDDDEGEEDDEDDDEIVDTDLGSRPTTKRQERHSTTSESDIDRPQTQSTDSDTENNGSQSPLLDLKSRSAYFTPKIIGSSVEKKPNQPQQRVQNGQSSDRSKRIGSDQSGTNTSEGASGGTTRSSKPNTKSEDSGCPSSDCDQVSASSKDMLLTATSTSSSTVKSTPGDPTWFDFDLNNISEDTMTTGDSAVASTTEANKTNSSDDLNEPKAVRSLGAIPKQPSKASSIANSKDSEANDGYVEMTKPRRGDTYTGEPADISRASSWSSSSRRCSAESSVAGPSMDFPDVLHQTKDGWTLKPSTATNPVTAASLGHPPPLFPNPVPRRPYTCFQPPPALPPRHLQPKLRISCSVRNPAPTPFDADDEHLTRTIVAWENSIAEGRDALGPGLMLQFGLPAHPNNERLRDQTNALGTAGTSSAGGERGASITHGGDEYGEAVFCDYWRHYNRPPAALVTPKRFYKYPFKCFGRHEVRISMDRLQLLALLDRDLGWFHAVIGVLLASAVSMLGASVLRLGIYKDVFAFLFCFVIAGSQYSLLKSVQPDAASPVHGFNKTVAFSRPIYFCLCAGLLIIAHNLSEHHPETSSNQFTPFTIFSISIVPCEFFSNVKYLMSLVLLFLPVFFSLGLFPQINTFLIYVLEQLDMHIFGGSAVCSLLAAFIGVIRSVLACLILYGPAFGGLSEPRGTQHVMFSTFCALLVAVSYHLSRSASDVSCIWSLIKSSLALHSDDEESEHLNPPERNPSITTEEKKLTEDSPSQSAPDVSKGDSQNPIDGTRVAETIQSSESSSTDLTPTPPVSTPKDAATELEDPLPRKLQQTVNSRLKNDFLVCIVIFLLLLSLHSSTVFTVLQPELNFILCVAVSVLGFILHYVVPQMRKHLPWLWFAEPILRTGEHGQYEPKEATRIMWFEQCYVYACFAERNVLYPLLFVAALTADSSVVATKFGVHLGTLIVVVCGLKGVRSSYTDPSSQYLIVMFSILLFLCDFKTASESFLIDYFVVAIVYRKFCEFLLKLQFIVTYIAPWQITWGSAFHAFAQPFSVPHSAMLFLQAAISAVLSTPLNPFLGSAIFLTSYVRPIKFWERDYNTRRIDHSNTRLSSQLERDLGADDNNLNSIFYEHLTRSLQHSLCGDLLLGRWGNVSQGDCFVLASDYLNCLVHIIELGNGLCTFQMRGLEFRGTYCQQREVEAISEGVQDNEGCCCCAPGHLPRMLSVNAMFSTRWLAWQVVASKYVLEGYSISDNLAQATLQMFEFRKVLISYYVKSIIFYTIRSNKLDQWLSSPTIKEALKTTTERSFVDLDPIFNHNLDEDFDYRSSGITRQSFCGVYMGWMQFCFSQRFAPKPTPPASAATQTTQPSRTYLDPHTTPTGGSEAAFQTTATSSASSSQPSTKTASAPNVSTTSTQVTADAAATARDRTAPGQSKKTPSSPNSSNNPTPSPRSYKKRNKERNARRLQREAMPPQEGTPFGLTRDSALVSLLLCLGLLARRTLATASHNNSLVTVVELFLHGLHALFKGDFRITSQRDEWVFADMDLLHSVVAPAVKMALKLHQDHFLSPEEYDDPAALYEAIETNTTDLVISHEADPLWRNAVLRGAPNLLALRHVLEDGSDEYRLIRLTKRYLGFRVIKVNRECVRGLWAGQQQELIYLRNRNPERGSIQNAKQALRNIINSSCDQPIGYPIYVSPLTTSYAETNEQLTQIVGGPITLESISHHMLRFCQRVRKRCREGCSSGSATLDSEMGELQGVYCNAPTPNNTMCGTTGTSSYGSQSLSGAGIRGSMASVGKPALLAGLLNRDQRETTDRESYRERGIKRRNSAATRTTDRDRRATLPVMMTEEREPTTTRHCSTLGAAAVTCDFRNQTNPEMYMSAAAAAAAEVSTQLHHHAMQLKPNSYSTGHLGSSTATRNLVISSDRKSKSEERHTTRDPYEFSEDHPQSSSFPPPRISLNRKVIIVDKSEIFDSLDQGRRIDVDWPSEEMRSAGGQSSWMDWTPQEGMVGFIVHYWQPNHPDPFFRSNFNRTLFLLQIGDRYVPVSELGVKEYNTIVASAFQQEKMRLSLVSSTLIAPRVVWDGERAQVLGGDSPPENCDDKVVAAAGAMAAGAAVEVAKAETPSEDGARGGCGDDSETGEDYVLSHDQSI